MAASGTLKSLLHVSPFFIPGLRQDVSDHRVKVTPGRATHTGDTVSDILSYQTTSRQYLYEKEKLLPLVSFSFDRFFCSSQLNPTLIDTESLGFGLTLSSVFF